MDHRNENAPPIELSPNSIIVMRSKKIVFMSPIGPTEKFDELVLVEWINQQATMAEWADRFLSAAFSDKKASSKQQLDDVKFFQTTQLLTKHNLKLQMQNITLTSSHLTIKKHF